MDAHTEAELGDGFGGRNNSLLAQCLSTCEDDAVEQPDAPLEKTLDFRPGDDARCAVIEDGRVLTIGASERTALAEHCGYEPAGPVHR